MKIKELPFKLPNKFIAYKPFDASRISILLAQESLCKEIYENFLHFRIEKEIEKENIKLDCHFNEEFSSIGVKKVPIDIITDLGIDFITFCRTAIEKDFYIFLPIETFEVSNYINYKKKYRPHHIFIYGYNNEKEVFYCSEFFSFDKGIYSSETVTYREMEEAYYKLQTELESKVMLNEWAQWMKDIQLLHSFREYNDKFNIKRLILGLQNFLEENDCYGNKNYIKDVFYGFAIYDLIIEYINNILKSSKSNFDIKSLSLIFYRFRYMKLQAQFIQENYSKYNQSIQSIIDSYWEMEEKSYNALKLAIKFSISHEKNILNKVINLIEELKKNDYIVTINYIECLKNII